MTRCKYEVAPTVAAARHLSLLTQEQELDLARRWQAQRDPQAAELLARALLGQVVKLALKYRGYGLPLCDLIGEGSLGIVLALSKFQPEHGVPFSAYATYWIRARLTSSVLPGRGLRRSTFFRLRRERARVFSEHGVGDAANRVLAQRLNTSVERLQEMLLSLSVQFVPLDSVLDDATAALPGWPCAPCDQEQELSSRQAGYQLERQIRRALESLDPRERYIAEQRLMADPQDQPSLSELACHFKVSRERVGQLEARAKRKLRASISELR